MGALTAIAGAPCAVGIAGLLTAIIGGFGIGFFAVLSGGCPFRNTILSAQGHKPAILYLIGFFVGALIFHLYIFDFIQRFFGC